MDEWKWKDLDILPLSPQLKILFSRILEEYSPLLGLKDDVLKWCGSKLGSYSFKIGYNLIENVETQTEWPSK